MRMLLAFVLLPLFATAQPSETARDTCEVGRACVRPVAHEWLFGVGGSNDLDTYLSPLEYRGPVVSLAHRSNRLARWGGGRVGVEGFYSARFARLQSPTKDNKYYEGDLLAGVAWHRVWAVRPSLRLGLGGMAEATAGFTYSANGGNNPAQGRLAADLALSALAEWQFTIRRQHLSLFSQMDVPLAGMAFAPTFGQSYYEIFALQKRDRNVRFTHPFNAPSLRWITTLRFPLWGATLSVGYMADIRQSDLNGVKHHTWNHSFVVGYVRRLRLLR